MKFEEDLMKLLMEKGLSDGTIFLYMKILRKLNGDKPLKNLKFLQDPNVIIESIKDYKDTTQRNMLISIVSILKTLKKDDLYKRYYQIMMDRTKIINDKPKNEKTETQKENWMNWDDVMKKYNNIYDNMVNLLEDGCLLHPETFNYENIKSLNINRFELNYKLDR